MVFRVNSTDVAFQPTLDCANRIGKEKIQPNTAEKKNPRQNWIKKHFKPTSTKKTIGHIDRILDRTDFSGQTLPEILAYECFFLPTLCNYFIFHQRRPIVFLYNQGSFLIHCRSKCLPSRLPMVFRVNSTDVAFRVTLDCSN